MGKNKMGPNTPINYNKASLPSSSKNNEPLPNKIGIMDKDLKKDVVNPNLNQNFDLGQRNTMPAKLGLQQPNYNIPPTPQIPNNLGRKDRAMNEEKPSTSGPGWGEEEQLANKGQSGIGSLNEQYIDQKFSHVSQELKNFVHDEVQN